MEVADGLVAGEVCARGVNEVDDARRGEQNSESGARRKSFVAEERADEQREDRNARAEERAVDGGRERDAFDVEELVEDDAEQAVEREAREVAAAWDCEASAQTQKDEEGRARARDAYGDEARARQCAQRDLADDGPRPEDELDGDERDVRPRAGLFAECGLRIADWLGLIH